MTDPLEIGVPGGSGGELKQVWDINLDERSNIELLDETPWGPNPILSLNPSDWLLLLTIGAGPTGPGRLPNKESDPFDHLS